MRRDTEVLRRPVANAEVHWKPVGVVTSEALWRPAVKTKAETLWMLAAKVEALWRGSNH